MSPRRSPSATTRGPAVALFGPRYDHQSLLPLCGSRGQNVTDELPARRAHVPVDIRQTRVGSSWVEGSEHPSPRSTRLCVQLAERVRRAGVQVRPKMPATHAEGPGSMMRTADGQEVQNRGPIAEQRSRPGFRYQC